MAEYIRDVLAIGALGSIWYGAGLIHPGGGWLAVGILVLAGLLWRMRGSDDTR